MRAATFVFLAAVSFAGDSAFAQTGSFSAGALGSIGGPSRLPRADSTPADNKTPREIFKTDAVSQLPKLISRLKRHAQESAANLRQVKSAVVNPSINEPMKVRNIKGHAVMQFKTAAGKKAAIATATETSSAAQADLKEAEAGKALVIPALTRPLKTGQCGILDPAMIFISQIVDEGNMLGKVPLDGRIDRMQSRTMLWVKGVKTSDLTDESTAVLAPGTIYRVVGHKQYPTAVGGTNTVMQIEVISRGELDEWLKRDY